MTLETPPGSLCRVAHLQLLQDTHSPVKDIILSQCAHHVTNLSCSAQALTGFPLLQVSVLKVELGEATQTQQRLMRRRKNLMDTLEQLKARAGCCTMTQCKSIAW